MASLLTQLPLYLFGKHQGGEKRFPSWDTTCGTAESDTAGVTSAVQTLSACWIPLIYSGAANVPFLLLTAM